MTNTLPVSKLIQVSVTITPTAAQAPNYNSCMIVGDSAVIDTTTRYRSYGGLPEVANDFGTTAPEYLAASLFFGQNPQPLQLYIGRWAYAATAAELFCAPLTSAQQAIANWTAVTTGSFEISINGSAHAVSALNFSGDTNLNGVASTIQTALAAFVAGTTCVWNANYERFVITSGTTGSSSTLSFLTPTGSGTDISGMLGGLSTSSGAYVVDGIVAETALTAVQQIESVFANWYGLTFAAGANNADIVDADHLAIAEYIEGDGNHHLYGVTTSEGAAIVPPDTTSIVAQLHALGYDRTFCQWSSENPFAACSIFGLGVTINFNAANSTITFMWKQEPGVVAEALNSNQAASLDANCCNYFAAFNNNTSTLVNGQVVSGHFIDEIWNADWFGGNIQTAVFNLLYTTPTKIPQTDAGMHLIATTIKSVCVAAVNNGFLAPGTWNSTGFGQISTGDFLPTGYYIYQPPLSSQSEAARAARQSVPFQVAAKEAGAVHDVQISVVVNA